MRRSGSSRRVSLCGGKRSAFRLPGNRTPCAPEMRRTGNPGNAADRHQRQLSLSERPELGRAGDRHFQSGKTGTGAQDRHCRTCHRSGNCGKSPLRHNPGIRSPAVRHLRSSPAASPVIAENGRSTVRVLFQRETGGRRLGQFQADHRRYFRSVPPPDSKFRAA